MIHGLLFFFYFFFHLFSTITAFGTDSVKSSNAVNLKTHGTLTVVNTTIGLKTYFILTSSSQFELTGRRVTMHLVVESGYFSLFNATLDCEWIPQQNCSIECYTDSLQYIFIPTGNYHSSCLCSISNNCNFVDSLDNIDNVSLSIINTIIDLTEYVSVSFLSSVLAFFVLFLLLSVVHLIICFYFCVYKGDFNRHFCPLCNMPHNNTMAINFYRLVTIMHWIAMNQTQL